MFMSPMQDLFQDFAQESVYKHIVEIFKRGPIEVQIQGGQSHTKRGKAISTCGERGGQINPTIIIMRSSKKLNILSLSLNIIIIMMKKN